MESRKGYLERKTRETEIRIELLLDGKGSFRGESGIGFFDHMLELFCKHSGFSVNLQARGDLDVDQHHTVEDVGLCLGQALFQALGDKKGIKRYASLALPMDEALVLCAVDISGRPGLFSELHFSSEKIGNFDSELVEEFWKAFAAEAKLTLHIRQLAGKNSHHLAEATFKGVARVLNEACRITGTDLPSSKGVL
jgi:imidazoleglycerol-phosphate dehydratase